MTRDPLCDCPTTYVTVLSPIVQTLVDDAANAVPLSSLFAFFSLLKFFSLSPSDCATTSVTVFSPIAQPIAKDLPLVSAFHTILDLRLARALSRLCCLGPTLHHPIATLPVCLQQTSGLAFVEFNAVEHIHSMPLALCDTAPSASPFLHRASLPPAPPSRVRQKRCSPRGGCCEFCCCCVVQHASETYYELPRIARFSRPLETVSTCLQHPGYHRRPYPYSRVILVALEDCRLWAV